MKHILIILALLQFNLYAVNEKVLTSKIKGVTVYQQGAQIHRKAYYNIPSGVSQLIIEGISKNISPKSIQVVGTGNMVILDSKYTIQYPEPVQQNKIPKHPKLDKEFALLNDSIFDVQYILMDLNNKIDVLNQQKMILQNNGAIKGVGKVNDSIPLLKEALVYYALKMNNVNADILKFTRQKSIQTKNQSRIQTRMNEIKNYNNNTHHNENSNTKPIHKIVITVSANSGTSGNLKVSYLVSNAGWLPLYDIRSNSSKNSIDLTYKAQVYQNTGIDWENTKLKLSTNNPYQNKTKPELSPFYINYHKMMTRNDNYNKKLLAPSMPIQTEAKMTTDDLESTYKESVDEIIEKDIDYAYNYTQMIEQLIDVEYAINLPYSIESNNEKHMVLVRQESLNTNYRFYSVPKLELSTYLMAEISNLDDLSLIPGNASIFHDGTYLGETYINTSTMDDTLSLSLGKETNLQVKHTLLKNDCKTRVIGDKTIKTYAYLIEVKNHKSSTASITIEDQIPVTQNSDIEIEIEDLSKGDLNVITGLIDWELKLKPKETKKIKLTYTVSYSKSKQINLTANH